MACWEVELHGQMLQHGLQTAGGGQLQSPELDMLLFSWVKVVITECVQHDVSTLNTWWMSGDNSLVSRPGQPIRPGVWSEHASWQAPSMFYSFAFNLASGISSPDSQVADSTVSPMLLQQTWSSRMD